MGRGSGRAVEGAPGPPLELRLCAGSQPRWSAAQRPGHRAPRFHVSTLNAPGHLWGVEAPLGSPRAASPPPSTCFFAMLIVTRQPAWDGRMLHFD